MRALFKVASILMALAALLVALTWGFLRAHAGNGTASPGSRLLSTDTRPLSHAAGTVELNGPFNLTLRQGSSPSLAVRGEQRLLANVDTALDGDTLRIAPRGILLRHRQPIEVLVTLPSLAALHANGSGRTSVSGFAGEHLQVQLNGPGAMRFNGRYRAIDAAVNGSGELELTGGNSESVVAEVTGAGDLTLVGATRSLRAEMRGSGDLDARHLRADAVSLLREGSGDTSLTARESVRVELTGSGDVVVYGNPNHREVSRTGSGSVDFSD